MIFITNYLKNPQKIFKETKRLLKTKGTLLIINYKGLTSELYSEREKNHMLPDEMQEILKNIGFKTKLYTKKLNSTEFYFIKANL